MAQTLLPDGEPPRKHPGEAQSYDYLLLLHIAAETLKQSVHQRGHGSRSNEGCPIVSAHGLDSGACGQQA